MKTYAMFSTQELGFQDAYKRAIHVRVQNVPRQAGDVLGSDRCGKITSSCRPLRARAPSKETYSAAICFKSYVLRTKSSQIIPMWWSEVPANALEGPTKTAGSSPHLGPRAAKCCGAVLFCCFSALKGAERRPRAV